MIARIAEEVFGVLLLGGVLISGWYGIRSLVRHLRQFDREDESATKQ